MALLWLWYPLAAALLVILLTRHLYHRLYSPLNATPSPASPPPVSVNYHFTRQCNKSCGFCFHTATTSFKMDEGSARRGLALLAGAGMKKINFAGGEPFLHPTFLGRLSRYCKEDLRLESVSVVTNGSLVREGWLRTYGRYVDIVAVSCDSFDEATNVAIGRGSGDNVRQLRQIAAWCGAAGVRFKLNTVVCRLSHGEDMNAGVAALRPFRWKCFQVLMVAGENDSERTLRDGRRFRITDEEYAAFCARHAGQGCLVPESNRVMAKSYLILDEYMRFLDREGKMPSPSILDVGVEAALAKVFWDRESFVERGGLYDWKKEDRAEGGGGCGTGGAEGLDW